MWFDILKIDTEGLPPGLQKIVEEYGDIKPEDTRTPLERSWDYAKKIARALDDTQIVGDEIHIRPPWLLKWIKTRYSRWYDRIMSGEINNYYLSFNLDSKEFCVYANWVFSKQFSRDKYVGEGGGRRPRYPREEYEKLKPQPKRYKHKICLRPGTGLPMGDNFVSAMLRAMAGYDKWIEMW